MKLDKKVYLILGAILIIAILGICWMVCNLEPANTNPNGEIPNGNIIKNEFNVNNLGTDSESNNQAVDFNAVLKKVKEKNVSDLQGLSKSEAEAKNVYTYEFDYLEYGIAVAGNEDENEYTEIWLVKTSSKDNRIFEVMSRRANEFTPAQKSSNIVIKEESNVAILIISNIASEIEKTIDDEILNASKDNTVINVNAEGKVSETQTTKESVNVEVKVEKENIEKVEIYAGQYNELGEESVEAKYNEEKKVYEAEVKFNADSEYATYEVVGIITDKNGNKEYMYISEVMHSDKVVLNTTAIKEDGKIKVSVNALSGGEILVTTTKDKPSANNANWQKYETDKIYEIETSNDNLETVYVWYKAGNEIALANEGVQVVADGTSNILMQRDFITVDYVSGTTLKDYQKEYTTSGIKRVVTYYALGAARANVANLEKYRADKITKIEFININETNAPTTYADTWYVDADENGTDIQAWVVETGEGTGLYNLIIGSYSKIILNSESDTLFGFYPMCTEIKGIEKLDTSIATNMGNMFYNCKSLTALDLRTFKTENVKNVSYMFFNCTKLFSLNVSSFNTSNVTSMEGMFRGCNALTSLEIKNFNTSKVTSMYGMFFNCIKLTSLDVSSFNTSNVTNMGGMFNVCSSLTSLDVSNFDTSKVTDMSNMFANSNQLAKLDLSNFNTSNVKNMYNMFGYSKGLTSIDVSSFDTGLVTNMNSMFRSTKVTELDLSNFNTASVTDMGSMINGCASLKTLLLGPKFDKIDGSTMFTGCTALTQIFSHATTPMTVGDSLGLAAGTTLWVPNSDVASKYGSITNATVKPIIALIGKNPIKIAIGSDYTDEGAKVLESTDSSVYGAYGYTMTASATTVPTDTVGTKNITYTLNYTDSGKTPATSAVTTVTRDIEVKTAPTLMARDVTTENYVAGTEVGLYQNKYTDNGVEKISSFYALGASRAEQNGAIEDKEKYTSDKIAKIEFININETNAPTTYADTWYVDEAASGTDIQAWVVETGEGTGIYNLIIGSYSKVLANKNSYVLFNLYTACTEIKGLSNLDTSKVTNMGYMFSACNSLTSLDVSNFNTSNVTHMSGMFYKCSNLTSLDVSNFNTNNVTNMECMFYKCSSLTSLDISNFNTSNVTDMRGMFTEGKSLISLNLNKSETQVFDTSNVKDMGHMFEGCGNLTSLDVSAFKTSNVTDMRFMFSGCTKIKELNVSKFNTSNVTDMTYMFGTCASLTSLDVSSFETGNVTYMASMFHNCHGIKKLDLSNFDTSSVTDMNRMFRSCIAIEELDLSSFDTTNVTTVAGMENILKGCTNLENIVLGSKFDKINGSAMFGECPNLKQIFSHATTPMTVGSSLGLAAGTTLWVPNPDVVANYSGVANASAFVAIKPIIALIGKNPIKVAVSSDYTDEGAKVLESTDSAVYGAYGYTMTASGTTVPTDTVGTKNITYTLNYTDSGKTPATSAVTTVTRDIEVKTAPTMMQRDFITEDYVEGTEVGAHQSKYTDNGVEKITSFYALGALRAEQNGAIEHKEKYTADKIAKIEFININETNAPTTYADTWYVDSSTSGTDIQVWVVETGTNTGMYNLIIGSYTKILANQFSSNLFRQYTACTEIKGLSKLDTSNVTRMDCMFGVCSSLTSLDLSSFNTSNVTKMDYMFSVCSSLTSLDLSSFNTSNVIIMEEMFYGCKSLTSLSISNFDTEDVTNMRAMFELCSSLTSLDVSNFKTSNVTTMRYMFNGCNNLTSLKLNKSETEIFDTSSVTNMGYMFSSCNSLTNLDVSEFDTSSVEVMEYMFYGCRGLTTLDVTNFDTKNVTNMSSMFYDCKGLTTLDVTMLDTKNVTNMSNMFNNCLKLTTLDLTGFDTSSVTDMNRMFRYCIALGNLDLSSFDTSKITTAAGMEKMFAGSTKLQSVLLGKDFDKFIGTDMFGECPNLKQIFSHATTPMTVGSSLGLAAGTTLWVPNPDVASKYGNITNATVKPIIELIGNNPENIQRGETYTDAGATVLESTDSSVYSKYGYTMTASATTLPTDTVGTKNITYTLNYTDSGKTPETKVVTTITRDINVGVIRNYSFGGNFYETLADAYAAIKDNGKEGTIKVEAEEVTDETELVVDNGMTIILDTNGKKIIKTVKGITNNGTLTISGNGTIETEMNCLISSVGIFNLNGANIIGNITSSNWSFININGGEINIASGKIELNSSASDVICAVYVINGKMNMTGGSIIGTGYNMYTVYLTGRNHEFTGGIISTKGEYSRSITLSGSANLKMNGTQAIVNGNNTRVVYLDSSSKLEVNGGQLINETANEINGEKLVIYALGNASIIVNGGTITSNSRASALICLDKSTLEVKGGKIINEGTTTGSDTKCIQARNSSNIIVTGGEIISKGYYAIDIANTILVVEEGTIQANSHAIRDFSTTNSITIGKDDGSVSKDNPVIIGGTDAIKANASFNFYDGILKGKEVAYVSATEPNTPTGYVPYVSNDGTYYTAILKKAIEVTLNKNSYEYTGKAITPNITVSWQGATLVAGTDYEVNCTGNINVGTNTGIVTVTGKGNYTGTLSKTFSITARPITITAGSKTFGYMGTPLTLESNDYTITGSGLASGHIISFIELQGSQTEVGSSASSIGNVVIKDANGTDVTSNYAITKVNGTLTVKAMPKLMERESNDTSTWAFDYALGAYRAGQKDSKYLKYTDDVINTITFTTDMSIPSGVDSWSVSQTESDNSIIAWAVPVSGSSTMYDLYIGAEGMIAATSGHHLFEGYINCTAINGLTLLDTSNVTDMWMMFTNCEKVTSLDVSKFNTSNVRTMYAMFDSCNALSSLNVSSFNTSNVTEMYAMFSDCRALTSLDISNFNTSKVTTMESMFYHCNNLTTLKLNKSETEFLNTSNVTKMNSMFSYCSSLSSIDVSKFDTSKVQNLTAMFNNCTSLVEADISNFNTSNVTSMRLMFGYCNKLKNIDVSKFNTSKVTNMSEMFRGCSTNTKLDVSNWNTSNVTDMSYMFLDCAAITKLDVSNWNTSNVTNMNRMFRSCTGLTELDLSSFNTNKVTIMENMFKGDSKLTTIILGKDFNKLIGPSMFGDMSALRKIIAQSTAITMKSGLGASTNVSLYVPNTAESTYETADVGAGNVFTAARIKPILALAGSTPVNLAYGATYTEAGATVAEYTTAQASNYTKFGYTLSNPVITNSNSQVISSIDTKVPGTYKVTYTLSYNRVNGKGEVIKDASNNPIIIPNQTVARTVVVNKVDINGSGITASIPTETRVYTGTAYTPVVTVKNGETPLTLNTDYTVAYTNNTNAGSNATITITGTGVYTGTRTITFTISKRPVTITAKNQTITYGETMATGVGQVTVSGLADNQSLSSITLTLSGSTITPSAAKIVASSADVTSNYAITYNNGTLTTNARDISGGTLTIEPTSYMYDGTAKKPATTVVVNSVTLSAENDYTVSCTNNTNVGTNTAIATVTGKGNYKGTLSKTFSITARPITITAGTKTFGYTGSPLTLGSNDYTITGSGLASGHVISFIELQGSQTAVGTSASSVGNVVIKDANGTDVTDNYVITKVNGTLAVKAMPRLMARESSDYALGAYRAGQKDSKYLKYTSDVINTINFTTDVTIPDGVDNWSVSEKESDNSIMAWAVPVNGSSTMYDLYIGAEGKIAATNGASLIKNYINCTAINNLPLLDTSNVTDMAYMFQNCAKITSLDLSKFNTSKVTSMEAIFSNCHNITNLDVSNFDTNKVTKMNDMFYRCRQLATLKLNKSETEYFNTSSATIMRQMFSECYSLTALDVSKFDTSKVTNMNQMFRECKLLTSLDVSKFNTSNVQNMLGMFYSCNSLTEIDVSKWNTSNVQTMREMFRGCGSLTGLDVSNFNTSNVTSMHRMFVDCSSLTTLDVSKFNTSNVTDMAYMFCSCNNLKVIDVSDFNTQKVTDMQNMFRNCKLIEKLDLSGFNTGKVTDMTNMFKGSSNLATITLGPNFDKINGSDMFGECGKLKLIFSHAETAMNIGSGIGANSNMTLYVPNASVVASYADQTNASAFGAIKPIIALIGDSPINVAIGSDYTDAGAKVLESTDSSVYGAYGYTMTASGTSVLTDTVGTKNITYTLNYTDSGKTPATSAVTTVTRNIEVKAMPTMMARDYTVASYTTGDPVGGHQYDYPDTSGRKIATFYALGATRLTTEKRNKYTADKIAKIEFINTNETAAPTTYADTWYVDADVNGRDIQAWVVETGTNTGMYNLIIGSYSKMMVNANGREFLGMYSSCTEIKGLNNIDTSNVTTMNGLFRKCLSLTSVDISSFNTSKVQTMAYMFISCNNLTSIDIKGINTSNVVSMECMFYECKSLTTVDVSEFNTSNLENMNGMFSTCQSLTSIDVKGFDTSKVTDMEGMFAACSSLKSLEVSNWVTDKVTKMNAMFSGCILLESVDVSNFNTSKVTDMRNMFGECKKLTKIDTSNFNTSNVTNMSYMFYYCSLLEEIDVSGFDTSNVTRMDYMFGMCSELTSLDISNFNTSNVTNMSNMFNGCTSLTSIDLTNFNTSKVTDMNRMFSYFSSIEKLDLSSFDTSKITTAAGMEKMFRGCTALESVVLGAKFDQIDGSGMFESCTALKQIFSHATTPMTVGDSLGLAAGTTLWVPNSDVASKYGSITNATVKPIIKLIGKNPLDVRIGSTYTDAGAKVVGLTDSSAYGVYGYSYSASATTVDTKTLGERSITYTLYYTDSGKTPETVQITTIERKINVIDTPITITSQPSAQAVKVGETAQFTVGAIGSNLKYQWYYTNTNSNSAGTLIGSTTLGSINSGLAEAIMKLENIQYGWNNYYVFCEVSNSEDKVISNTAKVTVYYKPSILTHPEDQAVKEGKPTAFRVEVQEGNPITTFQWQYKKGSEGAWTDIAGATSASYITDVTTASMNGYKYRCVIGNSQYVNVSVSNEATLTVYYKPSITTQPTSQTVTHPNKATFTIDVVAGNPNDITYQWQVSKDKGNTWADVVDGDGTNGTTREFTTSQTSVTMAGYEYRCLVGNAQYAGDERVISEAVKLLVDKIPPELTLQKSDIKLSKRESTIISYRYNGDGELSVSTSNESCATASIDTTQKIITITALNSVGTANITLTAKAGDTYLGGTTSVKVTVVEPEINGVIINNGASSTKNKAVIVMVDAENVEYIYISESNTEPQANDWKEYNKYFVYDLNAGNGEKTLYVWCKDEFGNVGEVKTEKINLQATYTLKLSSKQTYVGKYDTYIVQYAIKEDGGTYSAWQDNDIFEGLIPDKVYYAKTLLKDEEITQESDEIKFRAVYNESGVLVFEKL